ncbi:MAG: sugar phosphate isomerase/epimerase [Clostridia bacterium]|nr:sugar phosphate isomerase/epimerase [Clostridia bacterium]
MAYPVSTSIHLTFDKNYIIPIADQVSRIAKNGFEYLDFNFLDWFYDPRSPMVGNEWEKWVASAGDAAAKHGARFNQAHAPCPIFTCAHDKELLWELDRRSIIGCHMLGIPWMVYHAIPDPKQYGSNQDVFTFNREFFAPLQELSHKYGVGIAIENVWPVNEHLPYCRTEALIDFVDSFKDPLVGICWDTGHGNLTCNSNNYKGANRPELLKYADQYKNITMIGKRLKCLHIDDNAGMDDDHIPPLFGFINWRDVIRALDDIEYEHSFTFESHTSFEHLRDIGFTGETLDLNIRLLHRIGVDLVGLSRFK